MTTTTTDLIELAAAHLDAAAALAADATLYGTALAGQIRLTRAGLQPSPIDGDQAFPGPGTVTGRLHAAITVLDGIEPLDGPPDLIAWSWQISELARLVDDAWDGPR